MHRPNLNVFAQSFIPTHRYSFSVNRRDFRLLWAINCGSESLSPYVPIYRPDVLDMQLDIIVSLSLEVQLYIFEGVVYLPQLCQWYLRDFDNPQDNSIRSYRAILEVLLKFCRGEKEEQIITAVNAKRNIKIQFSAFNFKCRYLESFGGTTGK